MTGYVLQTIVVLVLVCGLAFAVMVAARKLGVGRGRGPVSLAGYLPLDARRGIYLVRVGGNVLIVGASEAGLVKIGEVAASELPVEVPSPSPFAKLLSGKLLASIKGGNRE
jgi:flagellar protein FliO/FliZ